MAGIADLYQKDESTASRDRLLSARSGVSNILQNAHKDAGWAAPGIAILQGQEAAKIGSENETSAKKQDFFATFGKLLGANGGAAAKFWTEHAKDVGIDAELESIDAKPNEVNVKFEGGKIVVIDKKNGTVQTPDDNGALRDWTKEDTDYVLNYKKSELDSKTSKGPAAEKNKRRVNLEKEYGDLITKAATAKLNGGKVLAPGEIQQNEARRAQIEADYLKEFGSPISKTPTPPAAPAAPTAQGGGLFPPGPAMNPIGAPGQGIGVMRPQSVVPAAPVQKKRPVF